MSEQIYKAIYEVTPFIKPFPAPEEVFAEPVSKYAKHLLPLVSVDMSAINSNWSEWIHFVMPIEPYDGVIGQNTKAYHNYYLRDNWIGFSLKNGRYEFLGDFRFFFLENPKGDKIVKASYRGERKKLEGYYQRCWKEYLKRKQQFLTFGSIYHQFAKTDADGRYNDKDRAAFVCGLGGKCHKGVNWGYEKNMPLFEENVLFEDGSYDIAATPLTEDGRPFSYIGDLYAWNYVEAMGGVLLLFYDPKKQIGLFTFDYT